MRILVAEDDYISKTIMKKFLMKYGDCDLAVDGLEALDLFVESIKEEKLYDLICLDIMMPKLDGIKALEAIRDIERQRGVEEEDRVKIIMVTALNDKETIMKAYDLGCEAYAWKPVDLKKLEEVLHNFGFEKL